MKRALLFAAVLACTVAFADVYVRSGTTAIGPVREVNAEADGGIMVYRPSATARAQFYCNPASATEKGCVDTNAQTFAGAKTFSGTLTSTSTSASCVSVDTNALRVDCANNRVGVNTTSPTTDLDVTGAGLFSGLVTAGSYRTTAGDFTSAQWGGSGCGSSVDHFDFDMNVPNLCAGDTYLRVRNGATNYAVIDANGVGSDFFGNLTATQTLAVTSITNDATTSGTVGALTLKAGANIAATDLILDVQDSAGAHALTVTENGYVTALGGLQISGSNTIAIENVSDSFSFTRGLGSAGHLIPFNDGAQDLGASGTNDWRAAYFSSSVNGTATGSTFSLTSATADATTSGTVGALTLKATADITATDLILDVQDSAGAHALTVTEAGAAAAASFTATAGTGSATYAAGGLLNASTTTVGNVGTGEDDLHSYSLPANTMVSTNRGLIWRAHGQAANNANTKTLKVYFGALAGNFSLPANQLLDWDVEVRLLRSGSNAQTYFIDFRAMNAGTITSQSFTSSTLTQTESGAITMKVTGEATSNNDITQLMTTIDYH